MKKRQPKISALISLLEDEDGQVSSMAMEQLLMLDRDADPLVAEFQEADSPVLRSRIHQIGNILKIRRSRDEFIRDIRSKTLSLWEGIVEINYQCDPRMDRQEVQSRLAELQKSLPGKLTAQRLARFMREGGFACPGEDVLGADLYLSEDVLEQRLGAPVLFCALAQHLGAVAGCRLEIILMRGKHCLMDTAGRVIEVSQGWSVRKLIREDRLHKCTDHQVWMAILSQLFLSTLLEGRLQFIYRVGSILANLCDEDFQNLPFPLGS